jgi:hypothetical protein
VKPRDVILEEEEEKDCSPIPDRQHKYFKNLNKEFKVDSKLKESISRSESDLLKQDSIMTIKDEEVEAG